MAFKLTKQEMARQVELRDKIADARSELDDVIAKETAVIEDSYATMNAAIDTYNEVVREANGFIEDIYDEREGEFDDKSENWQEGERGQAAREWLDALDSARGGLEDIESFAFEPPAMDFDDQSEVIDNLPVEAEF